MAKKTSSTNLFDTLDPQADNGKNEVNKEEKQDQSTHLKVVTSEQQTAQQETSATVETPVKEEVQEKAKADPKPKTQKKQTAPKQQEVTQYEDVPVYEGEVLDSSGRTLRDAIALSEQKFQELKNRPTMEETHIRRSYLIDRIIDAEFDKISKKRKRGWKTHAINEALVMYLDSLKK